MDTVITVTKLANALAQALGSSYAKHKRPEEHQQGREVAPKIHGGFETLSPLPPARRARDRKDLPCTPVMTRDDRAMYL